MLTNINSSVERSPPKLCYVVQQLISLANGDCLLPVVWDEIMFYTVSELVSKMTLNISVSFSLNFHLISQSLIHSQRFVFTTFFCSPIITIFLGLDQFFDGNFATHHGQLPILTFCSRKFEEMRSAYGTYLCKSDFALTYLNDWWWKPLWSLKELKFVHKGLGNASHQHPEFKLPDLTNRVKALSFNCICDCSPVTFSKIVKR